MVVFLPAKRFSQQLEGGKYPGGSWASCFVWITIELVFFQVIRQEDMINQLRKNNNQLHEQTTNDAERMLNMAEQVGDR